MFVRRGDELVGIAFRSRQWQVDVLEGEVAIHALGNSGGTQAILRLQPNGTAILDGVEIKLGASAASLVALAPLVASQLTTLKAAITAAPTVPNDGGAAFKAALVASLAAWPSTVSATKTKAV